MDANPIRVLLVDDDEDEFVFTRDLLAEVEGKRFTVDWVATWDAALEAMGRNQHDVCLVDYRLGARDGLELLREAVRRGCRAPIIMLTGQGDRDVDLEAMRLGAADYVIKGGEHSATLERSIRYAIEHKQAEEALRRWQEELERRVQERTADLAKANLLLQAEIGERRKAEEELRASLREKEVLLREVHHRVKNNLQIIASLLSIQSGYIQDPQARDLFRESLNRVKSIAGIHQKLVRANNLAQVEIAAYVRDLAGALFRCYGVDADAVKLTVDVDDLRLGIDTAIPCALIINELVTNALKHAFPPGRAGEIAIGLHAVGPNAYRLAVRDDGNAFPKDFDVHAAPSMGMQLVTALTEQLDGNLDVSTNGNTTFAITFKELKYRERR